MTTAEKLEVQWLWSLMIKDEIPTMLTLKCSSLFLKEM